MKKLIILLLVVSVFIVGCQASNQGDNPNRDGIESPEEGGGKGPAEDDKTKNEEANDLTNGKDIDRRQYEDIQLSVEEAYDMFMDKYPHAKINEIELELEDGGYEYEIEGYEGNTEYELKIDAFSKEVLKEEKSVERGEIGELKRNDLGKISKYVEEALRGAGDGYWVKEWELKVKSDYIKFEIEVKNDKGDKIEYKYDYESGQLLDKDD